MGESTLNKNLAQDRGAGTYHESGHFGRQTSPCSEIVQLVFYVNAMWNNFGSSIIFNEMLCSFTGCYLNNLPCCEPLIGKHHLVG